MTAKKILLWILFIALIAAFFWLIPGGDYAERNRLTGDFVKDVLKAGPQQKD